MNNWVLRFGVNPLPDTYMDNVIQMNALAMAVNNSAAINTVYNSAVGDRTTLNLKEFLSEYDSEIANVAVIYGQSHHKFTSNSPGTKESMSVEKYEIGIESI